MTKLSHTMSDYEDIINMEHHTSTRHPRMSMAARAAQFASFSALTGKGEITDDEEAQEAFDEHPAE